MLDIKYTLTKYFFLIGIYLSITSCTLFMSKPTTDININPPILNITNNERIGILPFSVLISDDVKIKISQYYNNQIENELIKLLKKNGIVNVIPIHYPHGQQPFTYEEMNAPAFEIDADDFATPEQILKGISSRKGFSQIVFGHVEEISDSLYLVARVYSNADNQIKTTNKKIRITNLTADGINTKISTLANDVANFIQTTKPNSVPSSPNKNDERLFGLDIHK
ncbi:MAG: hypothetical protein DRQ57_12930 [Gammaproteobacteria bacterium]|nr:MAG: hypothetical protein DRQ57_12930 [Gammaproteobacteria bacterium]